MADKIVVEELREAGEDGGDLQGYFCRGHVNADEFALAANDYSGALLPYDTRHVRSGHVRHVWYRTQQMPGEPKGTNWFKPSEPGPGAWPATVCESVVDREMAHSRRVIAEHDRGLSNGISRGINWALRFLEHRDPKLYEEMIAAARREPLDV